MTFIYKLDPHRTISPVDISDVLKSTSYVGAFETIESYHITACECIYVRVVSSCHATRWQSHHSIHCTENPMLHANSVDLYFIEPELLPTEVLHCRNGDCGPFLHL